MDEKFISTKLDELYKKEQYQHPIQTRPKSKAGVTGEVPSDEDLGLKTAPIEDEKEVKKDLGLKGSEKDIRTDKK